MIERAVALVALVLFAGTGLARGAGAADPDDHVALGPLDLDSQGPLQALRLGLRPVAPGTVEEGAWRLYVRETLTNVYAITADTQTLDFEMLQSRVLLAYGLSPSVQVELGYQNRSRFGGGLDRFIVEFHDLFGVEQNARDRNPRGRNVFQLAALGDDPAVDLDVDGTFAHDLLFGVRHDLSGRWRALPAISYALTSRVHLSGDDGLDGSAPVDLGVTTAAARRLSRRLHGYLNLAYTWHGEDRLQGLRLRRTQLAGLLALEWRLTGRVSLLVQYLLTEGAALERDIHSTPNHEIGIGVKFPVGRGASFEIGILDNVIEHNNAPDFGVHFGLEVGL